MEEVITDVILDQLTTDEAKAEYQLLLSRQKKAPVIIQAPVKVDVILEQLTTDEAKTEYARLLSRQKKTPKSNTKEYRLQNKLARKANPAQCELDKSYNNRYQKVFIWHKMISDRYTQLLVQKLLVSELTPTSESYATAQSNLQTLKTWVQEAKDAFTKHCRNLHTKDLTGQFCQEKYDKRINEMNKSFPDV